MYFLFSFFYIVWHSRYEILKQILYHGDGDDTGYVVLEATPHPCITKYWFDPKSVHVVFVVDEVAL